MNTTRSYLRTFRRIPPEIRQSMAARTFVMKNGRSCVCGWAIREELAFLGKPDFKEKLQEGFLGGLGVTATCVALFGGSQDEWLRLYWGTVNELPPSSNETRLYSPGELPKIETAFTIALLETV